MREVKGVASLASFFFFVNFPLLLYAVEKTVAPQKKKKKPCDITESYLELVFFVCFFLR